MPETQTQNTAAISAGQYRALQRSIVLPTPQELFDFMVERLKTKLEGTGIFSYAYADPFSKKVDGLVSQLFLLVPPQPKGLLEDRSLLDQLVSLIEANGKTGANYLDPKELADLVESPTGPSLLTNIEDGKMRLNTKPSISREKIRTEGRHPYTTWRGIIHGMVFPEVFTDHNMDLVGSRYGPAFTPYLCLGDGEPKLDAFWSDYALPEWGAPSCGSVEVGS